MNSVHRPAKAELVVSTPPVMLHCLSGDLLCTGLLVTVSPREPCTDNMQLHIIEQPEHHRVEQPSSNNVETAEIGFDSSHKVGQCTDTQTEKPSDSLQLELCTGLRLMLPNRTGPKTGAGRIQVDSGIADVCTGLLNLPTPGSTGPQVNHEDSTTSDEDLSSKPSKCDSQTSGNDSGILLHGYQYSQEQSRPRTIPRRSAAPFTSHRSQSKNHSHLQQEHTDILSHDHQNEFVVTSLALEPRLHEAAPIEKLVVVKQRPLEVLEFCPEDEIVMTASLPIPQSLTTHKADRLSIDRRHSDIRFFSCNMPTD